MNDQNRTRRSDLIKELAKDYFEKIFAFLFAAAIFTFLCYVALNPEKASNQNVTEIRTLFSNILIAIVYFYYGSSKSSRTKDQIIDKIIENGKEHKEEIKQ